VPWERARQGVSTRRLGRRDARLDLVSGWAVGELCSFGRDADLGFYSAAAQVIPVFFIALPVKTHRYISIDQGDNALA
jgi:hypothetical protein